MYKSEDWLKKHQDKIDSEAKEKADYISRQIEDLGYFHRQDL